MRFNWDYDYVKYRKKFFAFSIAITILGVLTLAIFGLNFGVDFKAGTNLDISVGQTIEKPKAVEILTKAGFPETMYTPPTVGGNQDRVTIRFDRVLSSDEVQKIEAAFVEVYGNRVSKEENTVDASIARELIGKAAMAVALASLGIILYVSIRFEWRFAVAGIAALLHDAFIVISVFSIFRLEVNLPFIVAVLTIIGYSINDTIVIFDRIRENLRFAKTKTFDDLAKLVNGSIAQTMTRSINTVLTVFVTAVALYIFGSPSIKLFSFAMIIGLISGAYSSIFIASPLWLLLKNNQLKNAKAAAAAAKE